MLRRQKHFETTGAHSLAGPCSGAASCMKNTTAQLSFSNGTRTTNTEGEHPSVKGNCKQSVEQKTTNHFLGMLSASAGRSKQFADRGRVFIVHVDICSVVVRVPWANVCLAGRCVLIFDCFHAKLGANRWSIM